MVYTTRHHTIREWGTIYVVMHVRLRDFAIIDACRGKTRQRLLLVCKQENHHITHFACTSSRPMYAVGRQPLSTDTTQTTSLGFGRRGLFTLHTAVLRGTSWCFLARGDARTTLSRRPANFRWGLWTAAAAVEPRSETTPSTTGRHHPKTPRSSVRDGA